MNYEETLSTLKAIQASYSPMPFLLDPDAEPRFVINSDERTITIPEEFKFLAVKMDHLSERIYFDIPRYFDGEDLATKICVVQYINANGEEAVEGIAAIVDVDYTSESGKIVFRWDVDNNVTKYAGDVSFSVRFYTISDDNRFTYSWNTVPATLPILDTIDNTGRTVTENYPTELLQWQYRMTELDRTISEKIADATEAIDADVTAAQTARKGAEDAESRVNAIVAGNEVYTKQQSHDLFALALRGTAEAAKSITIYPDKGSNVSVTAHGFTKQEGSGDPSPVNVRPIVNGGLRMYKLVIDGSQNIVKDIGSSGTVYFRVTGNFPANKGGVASVSYRYQVCNRAQIKNADGQTSGDYAWVYGEGLCRIAFFSRPWITTVEGMQAELAADPLIIWYVPEDEVLGTVLYTPLTGIGDGHAAACGELTAPLCKGDKFITKVKSGCDKKLVLDGSLNWSSNSANSPGSNTYAIYLNATEMGKLKIPTKAFGYCERYRWSNGFYSTNYPSIYAENVFAIRIAKSDLEKYGYDGTNDTGLTACKAYLTENPVPLWYKSTEYSEDNNLDVSLEQHVRFKVIMTGNEYPGSASIVDETGYYCFFEQMALAAVSDYNNDAECEYFKNAKAQLGPGYSSDKLNSFCLNNGQYGLRFVISHDVLGTTPQTSIVDLTKAVKAYFKRLYTEGNPVKVEYPLATSIVFAHDPVDFIASPDEEGAWVITGEADGTVSAEYNKNITKALEDILTRVSALELHALGG